MHKLLKIFLLFSFFAMGALTAESFKSGTQGKIERIYKIDSKVRFYILDDGSAWGGWDAPKKWSIGDDIIIDEPLMGFDDAKDFADDYDFFYRVSNLSKQDLTYMTNAGWVGSKPLTIVKVVTKKMDGDKVVLMTLNDGSKWKFNYLDETLVQSWKKEEEVLVFVHTKNNPHPLIQYDLNYSYHIINLNKKGHYFHPREPAIPVIE